MLRSTLALLFLVLPLIVTAQDQPTEGQIQVAAAIAAAGCGPSNVEFNVKADNQQHPMPQAEPGKTLIYVFEYDNLGNATTRIGLDGKWVGANRTGTYFFFGIDAGEHRLCVNIQSGDRAPSGTAGTLTALPGKTYYFAVLVGGGPLAPLQLQQLDDADGIYAIATHSLSVTPKPQQVDQKSDPDYNH